MSDDDVIAVLAQRRSAHAAELDTIQQTALAAATAGATSYEGATGHVLLLAEELDSWRDTCAELTGQVEAAHTELAQVAGLAELVAAVRTALDDTTDCAVADEEWTADRACVVCGCTDQDCRRCVDRTSAACSWVAAGLCSACAPLLESVRDQAIGSRHLVAGTFRSQPPVGHRRAVAAGAAGRGAAPHLASQPQGALAWADRGCRLRQGPSTGRGRRRAAADGAHGGRRRRHRQRLPDLGPRLVPAPPTGRHRAGRPRRPDRCLGRDRPRSCDLLPPRTIEDTSSDGAGTEASSAEPSPPPPWNKWGASVGSTSDDDAASAREASTARSTVCRQLLADDLPAEVVAALLADALLAGVRPDAFSPQACE